MPVGRYFVSHPFNRGESLTIEGSEWHHMVHVMRVKTGDSIELVNGKGQLAFAKIVECAKRTVNVTVDEVRSFPLPSNQLILAQGAVRLPKLKFIIEKGTELGVTSFFFYQGELCEKGRFPIEKLNSIAIGALKQCGRLYLPEIKYFSSLETCLDSLSIPCFFLDPHGEKITSPPKKGAFFVGPEKGFSSSELKLFEEKGAAGLCIHPHILRTETAGLALASVVSHLWVTE